MSEIILVEYNSNFDNKEYSAFDELVHISKHMTKQLQNNKPVVLLAPQNLIRDIKIFKE